MSTEAGAGVSGADDGTRWYEVPSGLSGASAARLRRTALERSGGVRLEHIGAHTARVEAARCENLIGSVQVPIGVAGPLRLRGEHVADENVFLPLATTEGALVASAARGCRALSRAGGATVRVEDIGITRAPVFHTGGIDASRRLIAWVTEHEADIRALVARSSSRLDLVEIRPQAVGASLYLRFRFTSGDAMGMNMATSACERVVRELIEPATGMYCTALSGNCCVDKKPAAINLLEGRGKRLYAEAVLPEGVLHRVLKTDAATLADVNYRKNLLGSAVAGSLGGFNAHYANITAAVFLATGQDIAQVVEAALGITCVEPRGSGAYVSVFLPDVPLGTVGGGTVLDAQREALRLLGIGGRPQGHDAMRLAEILAGAVLAGELSLLAALASGHLASAHQRLGRTVEP